MGFSLFNIVASCEQEVAILGDIVKLQAKKIIQRQNCVKSVSTNAHPCS